MKTMMTMCLKGSPIFCTKFLFYTCMSGLMINTNRLTLRYVYNYVPVYIIVFILTYLCLHCICICISYPMLLEESISYIYVTVYSFFSICTDYKLMLAF